MAHEHRILTINSGSSSIKLALHRMAKSEGLELSGKIDRIGLPGSHFEVKDGGGKILNRRETSLPDHDAALKVLLDWMEDNRCGESVDAVGHRVVHGGPNIRGPTPWVRNCSIP